MAARARGLPDAGPKKVKLVKKILSQRKEKQALVAKPKPPLMGVVERAIQKYMHRRKAS